MQFVRQADARSISLVFCPILYHFLPKEKGFFTTFRIFFKTPKAHTAGAAKMRKISVSASAIPKPSFNKKGLSAAKYTPPPSRQNSAPYSRICPPQAVWDQRNSPAVAASQNSRSSAAPTPGSLARSTRNRSYSAPKPPPSSSA